MYDTTIFYIIIRFFLAFTVTNLLFVIYLSLGSKEDVTTHAKCI
jgi:hypothetical protein